MAVRLAPALSTPEQAEAARALAPGPDSRPRRNKIGYGANYHAIAGHCVGVRSCCTVAANSAREEMMELRSSLRALLAAIICGTLGALASDRASAASLDVSVFFNESD